jgi:hypothetical protein
MDLNAIKKDYVQKYRLIGEQKFYRNLLSFAIKRLVFIQNDGYSGLLSPELDFLRLSENFLFLYRRESEDIYLDLSRVFRKAAHKIYRILLKKNLTSKNIKFLNAA